MPSTEKSLPDALFRAVMGSFASSVTVVTCCDAAGVPQGLTATAFSSVSREPPLCLVCVDEQARVLPHLLQVGRFAVNILSAGEAALSERFASQTDDKFQGVSWRLGPTGSPLLDASLAWLECRLSARYPGGDHQILVGELTHGWAREAGSPLVYFRGRYQAVADGGG